MLPGIAALHDAWELGYETGQLKQSWFDLAGNPYDSDQYPDWAPVPVES